MISALLLLTLAQTQMDPSPKWEGQPDIRPRVYRSEGPLRLTRMGGDDLAFFEFAPASGAGMPAACSTTAPTGAKGEVLTFTRASNGTCTKTATGGLATTGIANGDLVVLSSNQPRVSYDANGTLGLLVESSRTNSCLRSQELNNATWGSTSSGVAVPTVTADYAVAPDGTTTAERVQVPAVTAAQFSLLSQTITFSSTSSASMYVKGNGTSGTICLSINNASPDNVLCSYNSTTWTRCLLENKTPTGAIPLYIGNYGIAGGACAGAALVQDVLVWGVQAETGGATYATSYIPTVAATATRATEVNAAFTLSTAVWDLGSASMSWQPAATGIAVGQMWFGGSSNARLLYGSGSNILAFDGTNNPSTASGTTVNTTKRYWASWSTAGGWVVRNATDANQATSAFTVGTFADSATLQIGSGVAGITADGIISRVCLDPDPSRCR